MCSTDKIFQFINFLNERMYDNVEVLPGIIFQPFEMTTNGSDVMVNFMNTEVYNSVNDSSDGLNFDEIQEEILSESNKILESIKMMSLPVMGQ